MLKCKRKGFVLKEKDLFQKKRIYFKRKGFISKEKYFYTRRKGFLHLKEKDLFEKKSDQKKRKENFFFQPHLTS